MLETETESHNVNEIEDVQGSPDTRNITIDKVGVKDLRHPVRIQDRSGQISTRLLTSACMLNCPIISRGPTCHDLLRY